MAESNDVVHLARARASHRRACVCLHRSSDMCATNERLVVSASTLKCSNDPATDVSPLASLDATLSERALLQIDLAIGAAAVAKARIDATAHERALCLAHDVLIEHFRASVASARSAAAARVQALRANLSHARALARADAIALDARGETMERERSDVARRVELELERSRKFSSR